MYRIHNLQEKDIPKLCNLYTQLTDNVTNEAAVRKTLKEIQDDSHYSLICVYDDQDNLIATASLTRCFDLTDDAKFYYNMENFVVDEKWRHKGVGTFLMKKLEEYVREHNGRYMNFTSSNTRKGAHAFYKSLGYDPDYVKGFKKRLDN